MNSEKENKMTVVNKQSMSITRALVELKRMNDRITTAINQGRFVARTVGQRTHQKIAGHTETVEAMKARIQSSFDSVDGLIAQRERIKAAIVLSNASTLVTLLGRSISVAEAIELKGTVVYRKSYLNSLRSQLMRENLEIEKNNVALENSIDLSLKAVYGAEKSKIDASLVAAITMPQHEQKLAALFDPLKIEDKIAKIEKEVADLESEVDFTLSESNAKTLIEV